MSRTTVASRTIFYIHVEVVSLWMARRDEKETAGLENMSLANLVLIVEIFLKQPYLTKNASSFYLKFAHEINFP